MSEVFDEEASTPENEKVDPIMSSKIFDAEASTPAKSKRVCVDLSTVTVYDENGQVYDSAVTVNKNIISDRTHRRGVSNDSDMIEKTEHINRHHIANVMRGSTTVGVVNMEQIERIRTMHDKISDGASFSFNYICLLIVASIVAGLGLMTNSSTTVISSMLLSPIMGPVIGMSYGLVIWDIELIKKSVRVELISIIVCIFFGVLLSLCVAWTPLAGSWATDEMVSRGTRQTYLTGIPIAFFSGIGVALSVLDESTSSLVGVAISASLLPPAVNCGILFMFALQVKLNPRNREFDNTEGNFVAYGIMSLALTATNIFVVWLAAALMFRLKEVLPVKKKVFWDDLKHARRIYQKRAVLGESEDPYSDPSSNSSPRNNNVFVGAMHKMISNPIIHRRKSDDANLNEGGG